MHLNLIETFRYLLNELKQIYDERESRSIALLLLESEGFSNIMISIDADRKLSRRHITGLMEKLNELRKGKPVQYVLGKTEFYGLPFLVNEDVLIPRPETEEMVDKIIRKHTGESPVIIDIGTGSGCIAITLAKNIHNSEIFATDISEPSLDQARKNAEENGVYVKFVNDDIVNPCHPWEELFFDIIISNPPYVMPEDVKEMKPNVMNYEPHEALFTDPYDPFLYYRKILEFSDKYLKPGGYIYIEINETHGRDIEKIAKGFPFKTQSIQKDISGRDRFFMARMSLSKNR